MHAYNLVIFPLNVMIMATLHFIILIKFISTSITIEVVQWIPEYTEQFKLY